MLKIIIIFIISFLLSSFVVPMFIKLSHRLGVLDHPDCRKIHHSAVPKLGGLAVFVSFIIVFALFVGFNGNKINYIIIGSVMVMLTGLIDDIFSLRSWKVVGQLIAVLIVIRGDFIVSNLGDLFGFGDIVLGSLAIPFTIFSFLGVINAMNLIDGLDGLAGGITLLSLLFILVIGYSVLDKQVVMLCAAVSGATLGFILFNFNPAKIFMGDAGSNLLGFLLAAFAISLSVDSKASIAPIVPVALLFIPIFDTLLVMIKRFLNGSWPFAASNDHIHHKLLVIGFNQKQVWCLLIGAAIAIDLLTLIANEYLQPYIFTYIVFSLVFIFFGLVEYSYMKAQGRK